MDSFLIAFSGLIVVVGIILVCAIVGFILGAIAYWMFKQRSKKLAKIWAVIVFIATQFGIVVGLVVLGCAFAHKLILEHEEEDKRVE